MAAITQSPLEGLRRTFDQQDYKGTPIAPLSSRPYIVTNESNCAATRTLLKAEKDLRGTVHIGVSCWENYNLMLASGASYGILFDASKQVQILNDRTERIIAASHNRFEFMENFYQSFKEDPSLLLVDQNDQKLVRDNSVERLNRELKDPLSWLGSDENYDAIRKIYAEKKIVHIQMDMTDQLGLKKIKEWLDDRKLSCRTFYLSNVRDWILNTVVKEVSKKAAEQFKISLDELEKENPEAFEDFLLHVSGKLQLEKSVQENLLQILAPLIGKETLVIDAGYGLPRLKTNEQFPQYIFQGSSYLQGNLQSGFLKV